MRNIFRIAAHGDCNFQSKRLPPSPGDADLRTGSWIRCGGRIPDSDFGATSFHSKIRVEEERCGSPQTLRISAPDPGSDAEVGSRILILGQHQSIRKSSQKRDDASRIPDSHLARVKLIIVTFFFFRERQPELVIVAPPGLPGAARVSNRDLFLFRERQSELVIVTSPVPPQATFLFVFIVFDFIVFVYFFVFLFVQQLVFMFLIFLCIYVVWVSCFLLFYLFFIFIIFLFVYFVVFLILLFYLLSSLLYFCFICLLSYSYSLFYLLFLFINFPIFKFLSRLHVLFLIRFISSLF